MTTNPKNSKTPNAKPAKQRPQRGLGRGLSSLLGDAAVAATTAAVAEAATDSDHPQQVFGLTEIPVEWINSGPWQPRRRFDQDALADLASSIRHKGIVQPILVRPHKTKKNRYELIAGERRWRAAQLAQLHQVPAICRDFTDPEAYEIALVENVQRADLSVIEEAQGYEQLIETYKYTQSQLSDLIGKSRSHITNLLRLLTLPASVSDLVMDGHLTMGQVRPLVGHDDAARMAADIVKRGLSARQVEALVKKGPAKPSVKPAKSADVKALEQKAAIELGLKMDIDWDDAKEKGNIKLRCEDVDQLNATLEKLGLI